MSLACSFGFRPGLSAHDTLNALRNELMLIGSGWVLEADIRKFFDTLDHGHLRQLLRQRVRDGLFLRLIGKWLNAGILTEGERRSRLEDAVNSARETMRALKLAAACKYLPAVEVATAARDIESVIRVLWTLAYRG